jgi:hypothetical protein
MLHPPQITGAVVHSLTYLEGATSALELLAAASAAIAVFLLALFFLGVDA